MMELLKRLRNEKSRVTLIVLLTFMLSMSELYLPTLMADIVDTGIVNQDVPFIWRTGLWMLLVAFVGMAAAIIKQYLGSKVSTLFSKNLRRDVFHKIESFSLYEFNSIGASSLITRTTNDVTQVQNVVLMLLNIFLRAPMMAIGGVIMALTRDVPLSGLLLVVVVVMGILIGLIASKAVPLFRKLQVKVDQMNLVLRERLTGVRVIRAFNRKETEHNRYQDASGELRDTSLAITRLMALLNPIMLLLFNVTTVAILYFGAIRIDLGEMFVGDLMAFIQYAMQIMFSLVMFTMLFVILPRGQVSAKRILEVLNLENLNPDLTESKIGSETNDVVFDGVDFYYPHAEQPTLKNISFEAKLGQTIAIVGGTGSGKSTLVNLLPKFFLPTNGTIKVNGTSILDYTEHDIREQIGFVPQTAQLFTGSIRENVAFGHELSDEEITRAIEISQAKEFVDQLEDGLDHEITQGGTNVSGGQKQRLSIARALAKKRLIYIFDDSFSALDYKTDALLRETLKSELKDSITFVVAQRIASIMDADQILVLDNGSLVGVGTHESLLKDNNIYQDIVYSQLSKEELAHE